jgi:hypothetical protein
LSTHETVSFDVPALLQLEDVKRICGVGSNQAYLLMHGAGPIKLGRSIRVRPQDLSAYLERLRTGEVSL